MVRRALDRQAGAPPEIRPNGDSIIFQFRIPGIRAGSRLALRCDDQGNIWASVAKTESAFSNGDSRAI